MNPNNNPIHPEKRSKRTRIALLLLIGPTALFIAVLALFSVVNLANANTGSVADCDPTLSTSQPAETPDSLFGESATAVPGQCELFDETTPLETAANVILYIGGAVSFLTWLPGLIIGIVLLATRPKTNY